MAKTYTSDDSLFSKQLSKYNAQYSPPIDKPKPVQPPLRPKEYVTGYKAPPTATSATTINVPGRTGETIYSSISEDVMGQLRAREKVFSSTNRTDDQIFLMNSNTAWVRLISGVDVGGSSTVSEEYMLELNTDKIGLQGEVNPHTGELIKKETASYRLSDRGYRPIPGITSVSIESKNTYGTLREATINFVVWSPEDLDYIENLYFHPGYTALLEWGHSVWVDEGGVLKQHRSTLRDAFLKSSTSEQIEQAIEDKRVASSYNYDAMYGFIMNFSWDFRSDGGYECKTTIVSKGVVLESITAELPPFSSRDISPETAGEDNTDTTLAIPKDKSPFHKFFHSIVSAFPISHSKEPFPYSTRIKNNMIHEIPISSIDPEGAEWYSQKEVASKYVTLGYFLDFINNYILPASKGANLVEYYTGAGEPAGPYEVPSPFITSEFHFSVDPFICILPRTPSLDNHPNIPPNVNKDEMKKLLNQDKPSAISRLLKTIGNKISQLGGKNEDTINEEKEETITSEELGAIDSAGNWGLLKGTQDDILNIWVSLHVLGKVVENHFDKIKTDMSSANIYDLVQDLLSEIQAALGNVNEFDLYPNEHGTFYYVVDRRNTSKLEEPKNINVIGLKSTISNLQVSSKLTSKIASQIAIAAQASGPAYLKGGEAFLNWNTDLTDRHYTEKTLLLQQDSMESQNTAEKEWLGRVLFAFNIFNKGTYSAERFESIKGYYPEFCKRSVFNVYSEGEPTPGLIPVELSMDMMGVSGIKIGQTFCIPNGILPKNYGKDRVGFIIVGLSHSVEGGSWITTVKGLIYPRTKTGAETPKPDTLQGGKPGAATEEKPRTMYSDIKTTPSNPEQYKLPVAGGRLSSEFGGRLHPTKKEYKFHNGVDIAVKEGTPVYASKGGTAELINEGDKVGYGKYIRIVHDDGSYTEYGHLSSFSIRPGRVAQGQQIALSGNSGDSTGPHLHFRIMEKGAPKNPGFLWGK